MLKKQSETWKLSENVENSVTKLKLVIWKLTEYVKNTVRNFSGNGENTELETCKLTGNMK